MPVHLLGFGFLYIGESAFGILSAHGVCVRDGIWRQQADRPVWHDMWYDVMLENAGESIRSAMADKRSRCTFNAASLAKSESPRQCVSPFMHSDKTDWSAANL